MASKAFPFGPKEQLFFAAIVVACILFDLAVLPVHQLILGAIINSSFGDCVEAWLIGCFFTQVGILGCWSAMFSGSLLLRMLIANLVLVVVYFSIHWVMEEYFPDVLRMRQRWVEQTGWAMLVVCLNATQLPLLVMRRITGFSLGPRKEPIADRRFRQFSVAEILGLMTFASVPLLIMSVFLVPVKDVPFLAAITVASGVITWLIVWVALRPRLSAMGIIFLVLLGPGIVWLAFGLFLGRWTQSPWGTPVYWICLSAFLGVIFQASLVVLPTRLFGLRLLKSESPSEA